MIQISTIHRKDSHGIKYLQLGGHHGEVFMCSWNPNNKPMFSNAVSDNNKQYHQLATGSADGICRLWGLQDVSSEIWNINTHNNGSTSAVSPNISLHTGVLPHASYIGEKMKDVTSISWSGDGLFIATGMVCIRYKCIYNMYHPDILILIWYIAVLRVFYYSYLYTYICIHSSGCYDGLARIWNCVTGELKFLLKEHKESIFSVKWNRKSNQILTVSHDRRAIVWDSSTGKIVRIFENIHTAPILDVDWKDSDLFATCSTDGNIAICSLLTTAVDVVHVFSGHTDEINAICWSPDGSYLASCSDDTTAKVWVLQPTTAVDGSTSYSSSYLKYNLLGHNKEIYTNRWTPTGPGSNNPGKPLYLCTASFDGYVKVWDMLSGGLVYSLCSHSTLQNISNDDSAIQPVYSVSASPNGDYLAVGSQGGFVSVWDMKTGRMLVEEQGIGDTFDVSWSLDGVLLSACFASGIVNIMNVKNLLHNAITGNENDEMGMELSHGGNGNTEENISQTSMTIEMHNHEILSSDATTPIVLPKVNSVEVNQESDSTKVEELSIKMETEEM